MNPDYTKYTLVELYDAIDNIDKDIPNDTIYY